MGALGQFQNGPIQFNDDTGAIEARGTRPSPSATTSPAAPRAPSGDRMPPQVNVQPTDDTGGAPTAPGNDTSYAAQTPIGGALGQNFGNEDAEAPWKPGDFRTSIDPQPFEAINSKPFGNNIEWNSPFGGGLNGITVGHFEDGGEVDGGEEQQADPISVIKQALNFGRKKMGLPTNFTDGTSEQDEGQVMGFEDGGVIPEQGQPDEAMPSEGGNGLADPRKTIAYLAGDGAVSPEIAQALERHVDPDGAMDPSERTMATLNAAPDDESKFGMLQHYRTKYNGYSAGARAAMDQGNIGLAAKHATDAFDAVPTGQKISFAPAGAGGIAVMLKNGLEGARKFAGAGILGKAPIKAGDDAWQKFHGGGDEVPAMADGGEFEEDPTEVRDDATEVTGSINRTPASDGGSEQILRDHEAEGAEVDRQYAEEQARPPQPRSDGGSEGVLADHAAEGAALDAQPMILSKEQFKRLMTSGYDKPLDDGVKGVFEHIMDAVSSAMGPGAAQAQGLPTGNPAAGVPGQPSQGVKGYAKQGQPDEAPAPKRGPTDDTNDRMGNYQKRVEALADKLFPWASQTAQRNQYVGDAMAKVLESEGKVDQQTAKNQGDQKLVQEQFKQSQITARSEATRQSKWDMEMAKLDAKGANLRLQELGKVVRTEMLNHPNASAQDIAAKFGAPVSVVNQLLSQQPVSSGARGGAPVGGAPVPGGDPVASSEGPREGDTRPYTVKGVTKQYKFQNGQWRRQN